VLFLLIKADIFQLIGLGSKCHSPNTKGHNPAFKIISLAPPRSDDPRFDKIDHGLSSVTNEFQMLARY
jgi:hypothetical protein